MKKNIPCAIMFWLLSTSVFSYTYYQPYPLTAQITSNGSQWRLECTVYDSLLSITQYYYGPYISDSIDIYNSNGIAGYITVDNGNIADNMAGVVIYDMNLHQFQPLADHCAGCYLPGFSLSIDNVSASFRKQLNTGYVEIAAYYYDIKAALWIDYTAPSWVDGDCFLNSYGVLQCTEFDPDGDYESHYINPKLHEWTYLMSGWTACTTPAFQNYFDRALVDYNDCFSNGEYIGDYGTAGPAAVRGGFSDVTNLQQSYGVVSYKSHITQDYYFEVWDPQTGGSSWVYTVGNSNSVAIGNFSFCFLETNNIAVYAIYSFPQHSWILASDTIPGGISSISNTNETITIYPVSGPPITRGYIDSVGWGNYVTPLQPFFFAGNYSSPSEGNLIYVRDYSLGATSTSFDFGDGITTTNKSAFHLYKVNGSYRATSASSFTICLNANGVSGSQSSCQVISFPTQIEDIHQQSAMVIQNTGDPSVYQVINSNGNHIRIDVYNLMGQSVSSETTKQKQALVDLGRLQPSVYLISVTDISDNKSESKRVLTFGVNK